MTYPGVEFWSGQQFGWRYLAQTIDGTGAQGTWLDDELPLSDVSFTDVLSGPPQMTAKVEPLFPRLLGTDGRPILKPWRTAVYAEQDGEIRGGFLLVAASYESSVLSLDFSGFSGYPKGMGYGGDTSFVAADPLNVVRHIWQHLQGQQNSNLGMQLDPVTHTPVLIGKPLSTNDTTTTTQSTDDGPYRLVYWANDDLGGDIDDLAKNTPFDYHEQHFWNPDKTQVIHQLMFGYPRLGLRQKDLRFVLGENIQTVPTIEDDGSKFANHVRALGAGEGSAMIVAEARVNDGSLRRMVTIDDKSEGDQGRLQKAARGELARRVNLTATPSVVVRNTKMAPLGAWRVGDEIRIQAEEDWRSVDMWYRVLNMTIKPDAPELMGMDLLRSDLVV